MKLRKPFSSLFLGVTAVAALALLPLLSGCGNSAPPVKLDDAVEMTEDTLTTVLMGAPAGETISQAPPDKPLLKRGVYETVLIAADEKGFEKISRGSLRQDSIKEIEERVVRTVGKRLGRRGYTAKGIPYPPPADVLQDSDRALVATLVPTTQEAGSPEDKVRGKGRQMVLVRLTIADAKTGDILAVRDYYSGSDVVNPNKSRRSSDSSDKNNGGPDDLNRARDRASDPTRQ